MDSRTRRRSQAIPVRILMPRLPCSYQFSLLTLTPPDTALREVAEFLAGQTLAVDVETVSFSLTFPRCVAASFTCRRCARPIRQSMGRVEV